MADPAATGDRRATVARIAAFGLAGAAADLDLLAGAHSGPTHGLGAAVLVGGMVWVCGARRADAGRVALAVGLAYATHTLLDWLGHDSSPPIGIMALWPFSRDHYESGLHLFLAISRRYWLAESWIGNLRALARELAILLPIVAAVGLLRGRRRQPVTDA
jgi:hypothetical protein